MNRQTLTMNKKRGLVYYRFLNWNNNISGTGWPLYPHGFEETIRNGSIFYSEQSCSHMIVVLMLEGELLYNCQDKECIVEPGDIFIIPVGTDYTFKTAREKYYHKLVIEIKGSLLPVICSTLRLDYPQKLKASSGNIAEMEKTFREFEKILSEVPLDNQTNALAQIYGLLAQLSLMGENATVSKRPPLVDAVCVKLENKISVSLNMSELAKELGTCKSLLNRQFRAETGLSPLQYHIHAKMREAKRLLTYTNLTIKEIAYRVGYANQLYFSNAFRKSNDMSPREFRNHSRVTCG